MGTGLENVWHEVCREAVCMVNQGAERRRSRAVECPHPNGYIGTSSTTFETVTLERILEGAPLKARPPNAFPPPSPRPGLPP